MCSLFQFPGLAGIATGLLLIAFLWVLACALLPGGPFDMDIKGEKGTFLPLFNTYMDIAKFVLGIVSASIAALVGATVFSSNNRGTALSLKTFASPLYLLASSLVWGVLFMSLLAYFYEDYRHNLHEESTYTRRKYATIQALGFGCLLCFAFGYCWLIIIAVAQH